MRQCSGTLIIETGSYRLSSRNKVHTLAVKIKLFIHDDRIENQKEFLDNKKLNGIKITQRTVK
jgi:hypothetical protein